MWLLLVGIDLYPETAHCLQGAVNDVLDLELCLTDQDQDVKVHKFVAPIPHGSNQNSPLGCESSWPTRENITAAIDNIVRESTLEELVYFHYSGHGTLRPTADSGFAYQDDCGTDAALVLHEPKAQHGVRYLYGIELAMFLDRLVEKGLRLTVVLDACHSGSISRSEHGLVRSMPWNDVVASEFPLPESPAYELSVLHERLHRDATKSPHWLLRPQAYALWAACGPHQRAKELRVGKERHNGCLSYHILEAIDFFTRNKLSDVTHEELYQRVSAKMYSKDIRQDPILLGTTRAPFLQPRKRSRDLQSTLVVIKILEQDIWLNVGLIHGSHMGDEYLIYPNVKTTQSVACIKVIDVQALHSIATRSLQSSVSQEDDHQIKIGYCAVLSSIARPRAHVRLQAGLGNAVTDDIDKSVWLERLPSHELASFITTCFSVLINDRQEHAILDSNNCPVEDLPLLPTADHPGVLSALEHLAKVAFIRDLGNQTANTLLASDFTLAAISRADPRNHLDSESRISIPHNSLLDIEFHNLTIEILYFAVLNITPLRRVVQVYPGNKEHQFVLPLDSKRVLPNELAKDITPTSKKFALRMTVPQRIQTQQQQEQNSDQVSVQDELKFIVSTRPVHGMKAMEMPDTFAFIEKGKSVADAERDACYGARMCECLVDGHMDSWAMRNDMPPMRWASRSIKVCTILDTNDDRTE